MTRRRRYDEVLRADVLAAAGRALVTGGEASVSIRTVAADAGTTTAGIYALFGSRDRLIAAVVAEWVDEFRARIRDRDVLDDPLEEFYSLCHAYRRAACELPHAYRALAVVAQRHGTIRMSGELGEDPLTAAVRRLLGEDVTEAECLDHATTVYALVHGLVLMEIDHALSAAEGENEAMFGRALGRLALTSTYSREHP